MQPRLLALLATLTTLPVAHLGAQTAKYPPTEQYLMPRDAEIALARTAAPANVADHATVKVLTSRE